LIAQYQDEKATKTLLGIKNQTDKLQGLVSDLLDVSRIQTGKLSFKKEPFCINDLLKEIISVLQSTTSQQIILKKYPHVQINADKFRIYQVVTNLLTNAIKYSPQGEKIWIEIQSLKNKLVVSVKDQGIGIDKNQQKRIFDRLYQVTDAKEKKFPGLGMGLYISREIIKRHRGAIWVEGEKGKGSTFYFSLPLN
jgi:two-component system CheB/CheR fusion protein